MRSTASLFVVLARAKESSKKNEVLDLGEFFELLVKRNVNFNKYSSKILDFLSANPFITLHERSFAGIKSASWGFLYEPEFNEMHTQALKKRCERNLVPAIESVISRASITNIIDLSQITEILLTAYTKDDSINISALYDILEFFESARHKGKMIGIIGYKDSTGARIHLYDELELYLSSFLGMNDGFYESRENLDIVENFYKMQKSASLLFLAKTHDLDSILTVLPKEIIGEICNKMWLTCW